jgi:hypothetical protein
MTGISLYYPGLHHFAKRGWDVLAGSNMPCIFHNGVG